ncbi:hypothetical protein CAEBREN_22994 [Caenorhabditis brenneri]|uniref:Uncharacterized protein n=1 Tax=Caenorhabditis brenneri TaxID=135651 RepID=G0MIY2_CAEBE|nr:hypothetical protein CAEBREN_22994 [Caenorhabditis brenneri]
MLDKFRRLPFLVKENVWKQINWDELDYVKLVLELMKSKKLRYCLALSKTRISVDSIKFTLSSKNSEIKMKKGNKELTIRVSSWNTLDTLVIPIQHVLDTPDKLYSKRKSQSLLATMVS